jgi:hypothetical protein
MVLSSVLLALVGTFVLVAASSHEQLPRGATPDDVQCLSGERPNSLRQLWDNYDDPTHHGLHRILEYRQSSHSARTPHCICALFSLRSVHCVWYRYADHYERHAPPRHDSSPLTILEMGVQSGGSARAWKQWYGKRLTYVGVDVDLVTRRSHSPDEKIFVENGSQSDSAFLRGLCARYGPFDMVIDDAAHRPELIRASLAILYPEISGCMRSPRSLYVIEDTQTMLLGAHTRGGAAAMYDIVGEAFYALHAPHLNGLPHAKRSTWAPSRLVGASVGAGSEGSNAISGSHGSHGSSSAVGEMTGETAAVDLHPVFADLISAVHAYDSIVFLTRARHRRLINVKRPRDNGDFFGSGPKNATERVRLMSNKKKNPTGTSPK